MLTTEDNVRDLAEKIGSKSAQQKVEEILLETNGLLEARKFMLGYLYAYIEKTPVGEDEVRSYFHMLGFSSDESRKLSKALPTN